MTAAVMSRTVHTQTDLEYSNQHFVPRDTRTYLEVPFAEKDAAKALGARWDPHKIQWYAPAHVDLAPLSRWRHDRIYLRCGAEDRDTVEELGARHDRTVGWYILSNQDKEPFSRWLP